MMDCSKCHAQCRASCCSEVPMPPSFLKRHRPVREITEIVEYGGAVIAKTASGRCPFLGEDYRCSVYDDRPAICRVFGDGKTSFSTCHWQDADGRLLSRQERRALGRGFETRLSRLRRSVETGDRSTSFMTEREKSLHNSSLSFYHRSMPTWERIDLYRRAASEAVRRAIKKIMKIL